MHRRVRHLNAAAVSGALTVLDSRFIYGIADGGAIETWNSRTGSNDVTQSTGTQQPLYETNELNGNPVVRFDGSNDVMSCSFTTANVASAVYISKQNSTAAQFRRYFTLRSGATARLCTFRDGSDNTIGGFATAFGPRSLAFSGYNIATSVCSSSSFLLAVNGVTSTTSGSYNTSASSLDVGSGLDTSGPYPLPCDIAYLAVFTTELTAAMRRRLEQAAAFSFKLQCS